MPRRALTCRTCHKPRCMCEAREALLAAAREIDAAYAVVVVARETLRVIVARDAGLRPELVQLMTAVSTFDRAVEMRRDA